MNKVLAVSPAKSYVFICFWVYPSHTEIQQIWSYIDIEITCLKEILVTKKIIRIHRVQDIVIIWCVAARKLCFVVDSHVKICLVHCPIEWSSNTFMPSTPFWYRFDNIYEVLSIILIELAIVYQPSRHEELCPFPILIEKYRVLQLHWCEKFQSSWRSFHVFPYQNLICYISIWWKEHTYNKLIELFWLIIFINVRKNCHFWSCSISHSFVGICDMYLENSLLNFYFGFDIEKTLPVYIPSHLVISFI